MIPKKIHYCWFGEGPKNEVFQKCYASWKKYCPDYEIIEWNESNFDINSNKFVSEAYSKKKWAFVSDYVRLYALYTEGGIYVDTDLELTNKIDSFLIYSVFTSYETDTYIPTAIIGSKRGHHWIKELMSYYDDRKFVLKDGTMDLTTNVEIITQYTKNKYDLNLNNNHLVFGEDVNVFPKEYFCLKVAGKENYSIHHFNGSWIDNNTKLGLLKSYKNSYLILNKLLENKYGFENYLKEFIKENKKIIIYGAGTIGLLLTEMMLEMQVKPLYILDKNPKFNEFKGIKVFNKMKFDENSVVIITPTQYYQEILKELEENSPGLCAVSINEILGLRLEER